MDKNSRTTIVLPESLKIELQILCVMTKKRQSDFIRIAIQDKIKELKQNNCK